MKVSVKHWTKRSDVVPDMGHYMTTVSVLGEGGHTVVAVTLPGRLKRKEAKDAAYRKLLESGEHQIPMLRKSFA